MSNKIIGFPNTPDRDTSIDYISIVVIPETENYRRVTIETQTNRDKFSTIESLRKDILVPYFDEIFDRAKEELKRCMKNHK